MNLLSKIKASTSEKYTEKIISSKSWNNLRIGQKYAVAFAIIMGIFCISAVVIFMQLSTVHGKMSEVEKSGENSIIITEMASTFQILDSEVRLYAASSDVRHITQIDENRNLFKELAEQIKPAMKTEQMKEIHERLMNRQLQIEAIVEEEIIGAVKSRNRLALLDAEKRAYETIGENIKDLSSLRDLVKSESNKTITSATTNLGSSMIVMVLAIIITFIVATISMLVIGKIIKRQFVQVIEVANEIAGGNLNVESVSFEGKSEISVLSKAIDAMRESLQTMIQEISSVSRQVTEQSSFLTISSNEVKAASQQVASTMQELATGAEEQANSSTILAELMDSYTDKIQAANANGVNISESTSGVLDMTQKGSRYMDESTKQMQKINDLMKLSVDKVKGLDGQTKQISTLVQVIRDIANQTNLLALNAAIEAARAGEHGRGFAVVADEVRKLAVQVSHSVEDITEIVGSIQTESNNVAGILQTGYQEVEEGSKQIHVTEQTFNDINLSVSEMVDRIKTISENLKEVNESTVEINASIENIASVSEESAAGVEQTSASVQQTNSSMEQISDQAEQLSELAEQLNGMISRFKL